MELNAEKKRILSNYLEQFVSEKRKIRFEKILSERTSNVVLVLEDIFQSHNASAVLRSAECFGIQYVHFIENKNKFKVNEDIALGSSKWLSIHRHNVLENNTAITLTELKNRGYKIVAATPHSKSCGIDEINLTEKIALVFGTELEGLSEIALGMADDFVSIQMYGFTESFNISVSAAICMYELSKRIRTEKINYQLSDIEKQNIYFEWLKASVEQSEALIERFLKQNNN